MDLIVGSSTGVQIVPKEIMVFMFAKHENPRTDQDMSQTQVINN